MLSDFDLISVSAPEAEQVTIYPISDVHFGSIEHNKKVWEKFCAKVASEEGSYIILGGDMINNNTRSCVGSPWDDAIRPREQKKLMAEYLRPIKDKILCAVPGNHEMRSVKDVDDEPMYDIMCKLDIEERYRPNAAFVKFSVGSRQVGERTKPMQTYVFFVTHGTGGGVYTGASINRNERTAMMLDGVDCVITGHTHKGAITKPCKLRVDLHNNKVTMQPVVTVMLTAWQNYAGYPVRKMLLPAANSDAEAPQMLILSGKRKHKQIKAVW